MYRLIILAFLLPYLFISAGNFQAKIATDAGVKQRVQMKKLDKRSEILRDYLAKYNSPLQYHAQDFIDAADAYSVDWKLVPSIAGVESTFGKSIPGGFNGWGWGVYGDNAIYFASWRDGIFTVTEGLKENYIDKGLKDPYSMNRVYAASPHWGKNVTYFMSDLEKFTLTYGGEIPSEINSELKQELIKETTKENI
ncbi:glucosaminidase domain-containing protein, partial [Candidatus Daviesbacteria bacterium]|nr:glucosaminidase domain-containing protein [Candidatus Daviesbacteria bacterium]